jgi:hypothetical protein
MELVARRTPKARRRGRAHGRRRALWGIIARAAAFLVIAFAPSRGQSQMAVGAEPGLLRPGPLGDPRNLQRFRDGNLEQAIADSNRFRFEATSDESPPPDDGPNSAVLSRKPSRRARRPPKTTQPAPQGDTQLQEAQAAAVAAPESAAYQPTGVKAGSFLLKPALEVMAGYDSNPTRLQNAKASPVLVFAPELTVRSQFERHQLNADLRGTFTDFTAVPVANRPTADVKVSGLYDFDGKTSFNAEARYNLDRGVPGAIGALAGTAKLPLVSTFGGTAGVTHKFDNIEVSIKPSVDRMTFDSSVLVPGAVFTNRDRNLTQYGAQARVTYALTPEVSPFASVGFDRRVHDQTVDFGGFRRDSTGVAAEVGAKLLFPGKLAGEAAVGYLTRTYADPRLPNVGGFIADAALAYLPTEDTTFLFVAKSEAIESGLGGASGVLRRDAFAEIDQQFSPRLSGSLRADYGRDIFFGTGRANNRFSFGAGLVYKLSRFFQLKLDVQQEFLRSNMPNSSSRATVVTAGVRAQY